MLGRQVIRTRSNWRVGMHLGHEIAMALRSAYWALHRNTDAALQPLGITANQFVVLNILAEEKTLTQRRLADRANSDANTVGAMIGKLEAKGHVARTRRQGDRRVWEVSLTNAGRAAYRNAWRRSEDVRMQLLSELSPGEAELLSQLLRRVSAFVSNSDDRSGDTLSRKSMQPNDNK